MEEQGSDVHNAQQGDILGTPSLSPLSVHIDREGIPVTEHKNINSTGIDAPLQRKHETRRAGENWGRGSGGRDGGAPQDPPAAAAAAAAAASAHNSTASTARAGPPGKVVDTYDGRAPKHNSNRISLKSESVDPEDIVEASLQYEHDFDVDVELAWAVHPNSQAGVVKEHSKHADGKLWIEKVGDTGWNCCLTSQMDINSGVHFFTIDIDGANDPDRSGVIFAVGRIPENAGSFRGLVRFGLSGNCAPFLKQLPEFSAKVFRNAARLICKVDVDRDLIQVFRAGTVQPVLGCQGALERAKLIPQRAVGDDEKGPEVQESALKLVVFMHHQHDCIRVLHHRQGNSNRWRCAACTLINDASVEQCDACGASTPAAKPKPNHSYVQLRGPGSPDWVVLGEQVWTQEADTWIRQGKNGWNNMLVSRRGFRQGSIYFHVEILQLNPSDRSGLIFGIGSKNIAPAHYSGTIRIGMTGNSSHMTWKCKTDWSRISHLQFSIDIDADLVQVFSFDGDLLAVSQNKLSSIRQGAPVHMLVFGFFPGDSFRISQVPSLRWSCRSCSSVQHVDESYCPSCQSARHSDAALGNPLPRELPNIDLLVPAPLKARPVPSSAGALHSSDQLMVACGTPGAPVHVYVDSPIADSDKVWYLVSCDSFNTGFVGVGSIRLSSVDATKHAIGIDLLSRKIVNMQPSAMFDWNAFDGGSFKFFVLVDTSLDRVDIIGMDGKIIASAWGELAAHCSAHAGPVHLQICLASGTQLCDVRTLPAGLDVTQGSDYPPNGVGAHAAGTFTDVSAGFSRNRRQKQSTRWQISPAAIDKYLSFSDDNETCHVWDPQAAGGQFGGGGGGGGGGGDIALGAGGDPFRPAGSRQAWLQSCKSFRTGRFVFEVKNYFDSSSTGAFMRFGIGSQFSSFGSDDVCWVGMEGILHGAEDQDSWNPKVWGECRSFSIVLDVDQDIISWRYPNGQVAVEIRDHLRTHRIREAHFIVALSCSPGHFFSVRWPSPFSVSKFSSYVHVLRALTIASSPTHEQFDFLKNFRQELGLSDVDHSRALLEIKVPVAQWRLKEAGASAASVEISGRENTGDQDSEYAGQPVQLARPDDTEVKWGECVICLSADADHIVLPCRHLCVCASCSWHIKCGSECPRCRSVVDQVGKVFC